MQSFHTRIWRGCGQLEMSYIDMSFIRYEPEFNILYVKNEFFAYIPSTRIQSN